MGSVPTIRQAAREYIARGWSPVPVPKDSKRAVLSGWQKLRLCNDQVEAYFTNDANIGLILGEASGCLVDVDLDCPEAVELADDFLPSTPAVTGRPSRPGSHRWYYADVPKTKKYTDPIHGKMVVELRSNGGQTVVGPSIHPDGEPYERLTGEPARVPGPMLKACVEALYDAVLKQRYPDGVPAKPRPVLTTPAPPREIDPARVEERAIAYLAKMAPAISGQGGHSTTYAAAVAVAHGFAIEPERALQILLEEYNPRCEPPWSEKELAHKVSDAVNKPHERPRGWLRDAELPDIPEPNDVDISGIVSQVGGVRDSPTTDRIRDAPDDPGPIPDELLRVPGFVSEVMDYCMATAPYPNQALAFCGALAMQAFLAGRKVRDQADNRSNIYLLGLAYSAVGKDHPRKLNVQIAHHVGLAGAIGDTMASGEGIQDILATKPCMLFQTDEFDAILQSINKSKDARYEFLTRTLLTMYSSSNSVFPMRPKAKTGPNSEPPEPIDQPCLVIFGTAIPNHYYGALSERLLTNGFFARTMVVESGRRSEGQEPSLIDPPERILETARWWADLQPGHGNLEKWHPVPEVVHYTPEAQELLTSARKAAGIEYSQAEERGDPVGTTVWGRVNEQTRKLALLYAVSRNYRSPSIDGEAVTWADRFMTHQTRRMLFMAASHAADNPFHAECLKFLQKLREAPDRSLPRSVALKRMKMDAQSFQKLIQTLEQQGDIEPITVKTSGRTGIAYRLAEAG